MEAWMLFWSWVLYAGLGLFVILSVCVTIYGFRDILLMLEELRQDGTGG